MIDIKNFKISENKVSNARKALRGEVHGGTNDSPLVNPIRELFGDWVRSADLPDFFKDTSKKKSLRQYALTLEQMLQLTEGSWDPESLRVRMEKWGDLLSEMDPDSEGKQPEGSVFPCHELERLGYRTREHYALVSVASGFDWSARGLNLMSLLQGIGICRLLPEAIWTAWPIAVLVCIWVVYEGLGLSGYSQKVLDFHAAMRCYARKGNFKQFEVPKTLEKYRSNPDDLMFLRTIFMDLLEGEGIQPSIYTPGVYLADEIWEIILFLAHGREIQSQLARRGKLNEYLKKYTFCGMDPATVQFLCLAAQLQRAAAKGRLSLDEGDDYDSPNGLVNVLGRQCYQKHWVMLGKVKYPNLGVKSLLDIYPILKTWSKTRSGLLANERLGF